MDQKGFRELFFVGTNLSTRFAEVFSYEHTPRWCVADAVRISMSIPLFFAAKRSMRGDVYVDGGLIDNYPIKLFDREKYVDDKALVRVPPYYQSHNDALQAQGKDINPYVYNIETLGFRLDSAEEIAVFRDQAEPEHRKIDDFFAYVYGLVGTIMETQSSHEIWVSLSSDGGRSWSVPRFVIANAAAPNLANGWFNWQCSYLDAFTDDRILHLFVPHRWERCLHLQLPQAELTRLPTAQELQ